MTVQETIDGVVKAIRDSGMAYRIYTEKVEQGMKTPCFFVSCFNARSTDKFNTRVLKTHMISVKYFPNSETDAYNECMAVSDELVEALSMIEAGGSLVRVNGDIECNIIDGVLVCELEYQTLANRQEPEGEVMEILEQRGVVTDARNKKESYSFALQQRSDYKF